MKKFFVSLAFVFVALPALADPPSSMGGWELVFEDNFDGTSLDKSKWNPTYNWGHTHNHRAYCVEENVIVSDGTLKLKGEKKQHPDAEGKTAKFNNKEIPVDYTSGAIDTRGHFEVKYGYIEGRFKAPSQSGTWPAFWTLQDGWPPEIDILEIPASRKQHHYYLHYTDPSWYNSHGSAWDHEASFGGHKDDDVDRSAGFHNYAVEWDESNLNFYFDDKKFASFYKPTEIKQLTEQYIIVNLAIGGWAGDDIDISESKPAYFEADWVRVWKAKPPKPDTVKIFSMNFGTCIQPSDEGKVVLGDCANDAARAILTPLTSTTYRINFGDVVLEIPNEKTDAGLDVGLYKWNGGNHQKVVFEKQAGYEGTVVRMKMQHSNMYLRATTDGERVVQSWADDWEWNQVWRILPQETAVDVSTETAPKDSSAKDSTEKDTETKDTVKDSTAKESGKAAVSLLGKITGAYGTSVRYAGGLLFVEVGSAFSRGVEIRILDLRGREVMRQRVAHAATLNVKSLAPGLYHAVLSDGKRLEAKMFKK